MAGPANPAGLVISHSSPSASSVRPVMARMVDDERRRWLPASAARAHRRDGQAALGAGATHRLPPDGAPARERSEEHTSELQSLMRISYAVFCLKKKHRNHIQ